MNIASMRTAAVLAAVLLASCASTRDLEEHFAFNPPEGWYLAANSGSGDVIYLPPSETMENSTKRLFVQVAPKIYLTVGAWATSLLDTSKQSCPDTFEGDRVTTREYGLRVVTTSYYCPYSEEAKEGIVEVAKIIQGKEIDGIYLAEYILRVPRFNPGEKPADIDIASWQKKLESVQVCRGECK